MSEKQAINIKPAQYTYYFENNSTQCPILEYKLSSSNQKILPLTSEQSQIVMMDGSNIKLTSMTTPDEQSLKVYLVAESSGLVKAYHSMGIEITNKLLANKAPYLLGSLPSISIDGDLDIYRDEQQLKKLSEKHSFCVPYIDDEGDETSMNIIRDGIIVFYKPQIDQN